MLNRNSVVKLGISFWLLAGICGCGARTSDTNIRAGMQYIEELDYQSAIDSFENAIVEGEDPQLICRGQGIAYMGLGQYEEAIEQFLESISYADGHVTNLEFDTNYYLASAYYKLGKYKQAEKIYDAILALRSKELEAYYLRACTRLKEGMYEKSMKDFEEAFKLDSGNLDLIVDAYLELAESGYEDEGKVYLQTFLDNNVSVLKDAKKGKIYFYLEDYENARLYLDAALSQGDMSVALILGNTYEKLGDMNYASVVYKSYLEKNQPDAGVMNGLGICYMAQGKYEEALKTFQEGIELGNTSYLQNLKYNELVAYEYLGDFGKAKQLIQEYVTLYPDDTKVEKEYEFLSTR